MYISIPPSNKLEEPIAWWGWCTGIDLHDSNKWLFFRLPTRDKKKFDLCTFPPSRSYPTHTMADNVQYYLEQMVPELEDLEKKGLFSKVCDLDFQRLLNLTNKWDLDRDQVYHKETHQTGVCHSTSYSQEDRLLEIYWIWNERGDTAKETQSPYRQ